MAAEYARLGASAAYAFHDSYGGSALARITQAQASGMALMAPSAPAPLTRSATAPEAPALALTSLTAPPAVLEPAVARAPARSAAVFDSTPNVFGTVALRISHTAMDARWEHAVHSAPPTQERWRSAVSAASRLSEHARLELANTWVNHAITFESDLANYGVDDYWASASESIARGRGDCEDYAIAKMALLREAGVPASDLYLVIARDLVRRADHALLLVRLDDGYWVLDSATDDVLAASAVADYRPLVTYSSAGKEWVHGYRRTPTVVLATASAQVTPSYGR